jgi:hypothetical protein
VVAGRKARPGAPVAGVGERARSASNPLGRMAVPPIRAAS